MEISLKLPELCHFAFELADDHVLLLAFALRCEVRLAGGVGVVEVLAEHNDYNIFISHPHHKYKYHYQPKTDTGTQFNTRIDSQQIFLPLLVDMMFDANLNEIL